MSSEDVSLYLVRHGQTEGNLRNLFTGSTDLPLDDVGKRQAHRLAERFREVPIDAIVSSPLLRAVQTAEAMAALHDATVDIHPGLKEIDFGEAEGLTVDEVSERFPDLFLQHAQAESGGVRWPGGESRKAFSERVVACLLDVCRTYAGKRVVVVCHGGVIGALLSHIDGGLLNDWRKYSVHNCSITSITMSEDRLGILSMDDHGHLEEVQRDLFTLEPSSE